jgi:nitrogen fixation-related uncharacterized protein
LVLAIGAGFWWSVKSGQFDDLEGPAYRILDDDDTGVVPTRDTDELAPSREGQLTSIKVPGDRPH